MKVIFFTFTADILADAFLLFAPLRVLAPLQDKHLRMRLVVIFSSCIITTLVRRAYSRAIFPLQLITTYVFQVFLVHAAFIITTGGIPVIISAVSLMVANAPVVVAAILRSADIHFPRIEHSASLATLAVVPGGDTELKGEEETTVEVGMETGKVGSTSDKA